MPAVCCVRGEDGGDLLQFETIKCKQATCDGPPDGAPMGLAVQVPVVVVGASTPTSKDQRHRPPALQLAACHAPLLVAQPSLVREATPMSPRTPRLRPPTPRQCIPLVTVTTSRSPSLQLQPQQQQQQLHSPTFQRLFQLSGSFGHTSGSPVSPANTPTARRQIRQPSQGPSPFSPAGNRQFVVHAGPDEASSPCHRHCSFQSPKSDSGTRKVEHEKAPKARRSSSTSIEKPSLVAEPFEREATQQENSKPQLLTGSIDDSNTTAPPSPTVYYGTPNFTNRSLRCDDVHLRISGNPFSRSDRNLDLPNLSSGSLAPKSSVDIDKW